MEQSFFIVCIMRGEQGLAYVGPFVGPAHEGYDSAQAFIDSNHERIGGMPMWIAEIVQPDIWLEENVGARN